MRILHVTEQIYRSSGVSVWCVELCEKLAGMGHFVRLALQNPCYKNPYPVRDQDMLMSNDQAISRFDEDKWDVVHINGVWNWPYHQISKLARRRGIPVVWSPHGSLTPWALGHKRLKKFLAWAIYQKRDLKRANLLHVTAQSEVEDMRRLELRNETFVLPLGVDFRFTDKELTHIKATVKDNHILFVSRIHPKKGIDNLIKAWAVLKKDVPCLVDGWQVDIVGGCDLPGYMEELDILAMNEGVDKDVRFLGPLYGDDKELAYANARLFVLPTHSENFGSVVIEALANGTPVITTRGTPWKELVEEQCGWWVDVGVDPLVGALREALSLNVAKLLQMGNCGRMLVASRYEWKAVANQMIARYKKLTIT